LAGLGDHEVRRFDVAVNDAGGVSPGEPGAHLGHQPELFRDAHLGATLDLFFERLPLDVLHHDERRVLERAVVVDVNDVGVTERRERARFAIEAIADVARVEGRVQQLDHDHAGRVRIAREIDARHPAPGDQGLDFIAADSVRAVTESHVTTRSP
jgi:hypothetical protein